MTDAQKRMKTIISFTYLFFAFLSSAHAQEELNETSYHRHTLGISFQLYPAGVITTITTEYIQINNSSLLLRIGGNFADRKDYSDYNDNETGAGFGGTIGYRRYFHMGNGKIIAGLNTDIWNMWINWKNDIGEANETSGQTYTLVLQPWLESGYFLQLNNSPIQLGITLGFGREINIITDGKDVGQGWMLSLLFYGQYAF